MILATAAVLVGGKSRRMQGARKAFVEYDGRIFLEYALKCVSDFVEILIVCEEAELGAYMNWLDDFTAPYRDRIKLVADLQDDKGPVCGIYTALCRATYENVAIAPVDMPLLKSPFYRAAYFRVQDKKEQTSCVLAKVDGRVYPVVGIYKRKLRSVFEQSLSQNQLRMMAVIERINPVYLTEQDFKTDNLKGQFVNINTLDRLTDLAV